MKPSIAPSQSFFTVIP